MDTKAKIAAMHRISDVGGAVILKPARKGRKMTATVKLRNTDLASIHGHHVPGTAFTYRHGWIPRKGDVVHDPRQLKHLPVGTELTHHSKGGLGKNTVVYKFHDNTYGSVETPKGERQNESDFGTYVNSGNYFHVTSMPDAGDQEMLKEMHGVHADLRADDNIVVRKSSKPKSVKAGKSRRGAPNAGDIANAYLSAHGRTTLDNALTPGGRAGDASSLAKPGYKGKRKLSDYEREVAHALMRKGHPKQRAIAMARGIIRNAATVGKWGPHAVKNPAVRAGAAASIAQRKSFTNNEPARIMDLANAASAAYVEASVRQGEVIDLAARYRHGWIPINPGIGGAKSRVTSVTSRERKLRALPSAKLNSMLGQARGTDVTPKDKKIITSELAKRGMQSAYGMKGSVPRTNRETRLRVLPSAKLNSMMNQARGTGVTPKDMKIITSELAKRGRRNAGLSLSETTDLAAGARWKHGWIPLNPEAVLEKGKTQRKSGGAAPNVKKVHSVSTKHTMSDTGLREHARVHAAAAGRARSDATREVHVREAQASMNLVLNRQSSRKAHKSVAGESRAQRSVTPMLPENQTVGRGAAAGKARRAAEAEVAKRKARFDAGAAEAKSTDNKTLPKGWTRNVARAKEESKREIVRKASIKEPPVFVGRKKGEDSEGGITEGKVERAKLRETKGGKSSKSTAGVADPEAVAVVLKTAGPPPNPKLAAMNPKDLTKAIKDAKDMKPGSARTRKLNQLNAEKARRIAAVKALNRQAYEAKKLVDSSWPDGKEPLEIHNSFVKRLIKIFPALRSKLKKIRNEDGTLKGKDVLLTVIDESVRQFARTIAGPLIASGLFTVGFHIATAAG